MATIEAVGQSLTVELETGDVDTLTLDASISKLESLKKIENQADLINNMNVVLSAFPFPASQALSAGLSIAQGFLSEPPTVPEPPAVQVGKILLNAMNVQTDVIMQRLSELESGVKNTIMTQVSEIGLNVRERYAVEAAKITDEYVSKINEMNDEFLVVTEQIDGAFDVEKINRYNDIILPAVNMYDEILNDYIEAKSVEFKNYLQDKIDYLKKVRSVQAEIDEICSYDPIETAKKIVDGVRIGLKL